MSATNYIVLIMVLIKENSLENVGFDSVWLPKKYLMALLHWSVPSEESVDMNADKEITEQLLIGASTGMHLIHEDAQMLEAFSGTTFPLNEVYYVGELFFRPAYRTSKPLQEGKDT
jgi:hypothetical protein